MKKIAIVFSLGVFAFACSPKTAPTTSTTTDTNQNTTVNSNTNNNSTSNNTAMIAAGHQVYDTRCNRCHGLKDVTKYTAERWDGILKSMIPKAKLDETQAQQVTAYVMANARK